MQVLQYIIINVTNIGNIVHISSLVQVLYVYEYSHSVWADDVVIASTSECNTV